MSNYPYTSPAPALSGFYSYQRYGYTPEDMVAGITDNYTSINKASLRRTLGTEIAKVENFVNQHTLGRTINPVEDAYIQNLHIDASGYLNFSEQTGSTNITTNCNFTPTTSYNLFYMSSTSDVTVTLVAGDMPDGSMIFIGQADLTPSPARGYIRIFNGINSTILDSSTAAVFIKFNSIWFSLGAQDLTFTSQNPVIFMELLKTLGFGYDPDSTNIITIPSGTIGLVIDDLACYNHIVVEPDSGKTTGTKIMLLLNGITTTVNYNGLVNTFYYKSGPSDVYIQLYGMSYDNRRILELAVGESCQFIKIANDTDAWSPITSHPSGTY